MLRSVDGRQFVLQATELRDKRDRDQGRKDEVDLFVCRVLLRCLFIDEAFVPLTAY